MPRYLLTIAYDGTDFHGWQAQARPAHQEGPDLRTVQGVMQHALALSLGQPVLLQGASRTDAGVHALGQRAHFDAQTRIPLERLALAINARLPPDVDVRAAQCVPDDFDAVRHAVSKQYRYRFRLGTHRPLLARRHVHHVFVPVEPEPMRQAAVKLVGEHDFAAFAAADHDRLTTIRTIHDCRVEIAEGSDPLAGRELHLVVSGSGFLYNMVRIIAGTLLEIGRGRWTPDRIDQLLADPRRQLAGPTAPPQGLCLEWIRYAGIA
jgi:tRNA pseudouridine38-40 synthase